MCEGFIKEKNEIKPILKCFNEKCDLNLLMKI